MNVDLRNCDKEEMESIVNELGEKPFRSKQLYEWIHQKLVGSFEEMTNIPATLRKSLIENYGLGTIKIIEKQVSSFDTTAKYLFLLSDGNMMESVWMQYKHGNSVCISSQVGCKMGCVFCASTKGGKKNSVQGGYIRSLTVGEMLSQVYEIQRETKERISNIVIMGMGEPLDNLDNTIKFIKMISHEQGLHISQRNITISTCGLIPQIKKMQEERLQVTLAISLHAPNDAIRKELMPVANNYTMKELLTTCKNYVEKTKRRITFEYCLIRGVNDGKEHALELIKHLKHINCHVNLIPINEIKEYGFICPTERECEEFKKTLEKNRINVTIRRGMGSDIDAACGQLRKRFLDMEVSDDKPSLVEKVIS